MMCLTCGAAVDLFCAMFSVLCVVCCFCCPVACAACLFSQVEVVKGVLDHFLIEPFYPHAQSDEFYVCIHSLRPGDEILFYHEVNTHRNQPPHLFFCYFAVSQVACSSPVRSSCAYCKGSPDLSDALAHHADTKPASLIRSCLLCVCVFAVHREEWMWATSTRRPRA